MPANLGGAPLCRVCNDRVYYNEEKAFMGRSWHKRCFVCARCNKALENTSANLDEAEDGLYCNPCYRKMLQPAGAADAQQQQQQPKRTEYVNKEDVECCPRCGKRVFFAEQILNLGRKWHKSCFACCECSKKLDSAMAADHGGELYCKSCHVRKFGPKGYGFAGGAGSGLSMDTGVPDEVTTENVPHTSEAHVAPVAERVQEQNGRNGHNGAAKERPKWGGGDYCARCDKQVFFAEKVAAAGSTYHKTCFTCFCCSKKLDSGMLTEKEGEIYCKACYGKNFGPKGYGFGVGAGTLSMTS